MKLSKEDIESIANSIITKMAENSGEVKHLSEYIETNIFIWVWVGLFITLICYYFQLDRTVRSKWYEYKKKHNPDLHAAQAKKHQKENKVRKDNIFLVLIITVCGFGSMLALKALQYDIASIFMGVLTFGLSLILLIIQLKERKYLMKGMFRIMLGFLVLLYVIPIGMMLYDKNLVALNELALAVSIVGFPLALVGLILALK